MVVDLAEVGIGKAATAKLRQLYGEHVLPDSFLALWNNGCRRLSHVIPADRDPVAERPRVAKLMMQWLVTNLLQVDGCPTLTRFFSFRNKTDAMLVMVLLDMPQHAIRIRSGGPVPREENRKRMENVHAFFKKEEAWQLLRRVSIGFQLTGGVEALVSRVPAENCSAATPPPIVRLCRGEADTLVKV